MGKGNYYVCLQLGFASFNSWCVAALILLLIASCIASFAANMIDAHGVHKHACSILWLCCLCVVLPCYYLFLSLSLYDFDDVQKCTWFSVDVSYLCVYDLEFEFVPQEHVYTQRLTACVDELCVLPFTHV